MIVSMFRSPNSMTSASTQFASSMRIGGMYDRDHQLGGMWNDPYQVDDSQTTSPSLGDVKLDNPVRFLQFCNPFLVVIFLDLQIIQNIYSGVCK